MCTYVTIYVKTYGKFSHSCTISELDISRGGGRSGGNKYFLHSTNPPEPTKYPNYESVNTMYNLKHHGGEV